MDVNYLAKNDNVAAADGARSVKSALRHEAGVSPPDVLHALVRVG